MLSATALRHVKISIHALHEESDQVGVSQRLTCLIFQSTLSMRRATGRFDGEIIEVPLISIHALHEESDCILININKR